MIPSGAMTIITNRISAILGLLLVIDANTSLQAGPAERRTWRFEAQGGEPNLTFGSGNPEDSPVSFSCKKGRASVAVFISETNQRMKPGRTMTASLTAAPVTSKVSGRTEPNEEAGAPSFSGTMPASDPLFAALSKAPLLVMVVGSSRQQVPLRTIGDKADRLQRSCQKG